jgi:hypothetical protein
MDCIPKTNAVAAKEHGPESFPSPASGQSASPATPVQKPSSIHPGKPLVSGTPESNLTAAGIDHQKLLPAPATMQAAAGAAWTFIHLSTIVHAHEVLEGWAPKRNGCTDQCRPFQAATVQARRPFSLLFSGSNSRRFLPTESIERIPLYWLTVVRAGMVGAVVVIETPRIIVDVQKAVCMVITIGFAITRIAEPPWGPVTRLPRCLPGVT